MQTYEPEKRIKDEFRVRKRRQIVASVVFATAVLPLMILRHGGSEQIGGISSNILLPLALVILAGVVAFSIRNWRCPACRRYLGRTMNPTFCSKCGAKLSDCAYRPSPTFNRGVVHLCRWQSYRYARPQQQTPLLPQRSSRFDTGGIRFHRFSRGQVLVLCLRRFAVRAGEHEPGLSLYCKTIGQRKRHQLILLWRPLL